MTTSARGKRLFSYAAIMGVLLLPGEAASEYGAAPGTFRGSEQSSACVGGEEKCGGILISRSNINARIDWQAGPLVGEPVIDTRIAWNTTLGGVTGLVPPIYGEADPDLFYNSGEAAEHLRLYDATARLTVHYGNQTYTIDSDLGVPDKAGDRSSYNVAASPSWDRLFRDRNGDFISAAQAKEIFGSSSMAGAQATLVSAKMDTGKFEEWWLDKNVERYAAPLRAAIDGRLAALEESFGLPTDDLRAEIAALKGGNNARTLIGRLEGILQKLAPDRIPAKFLGEGPQKLARLHSYGLSIASTEDALRAATRGLPPMPGASKAYETWYDQVAVRMNNDAARLAHLRGLKAEAERAEREAAAAAQRVKERAERLAAEKQARAAARERQRRRNAAQPQKSFSDEFGIAEDDAYAGNSGFGATGWSATMNNYQLSITPGYYSSIQGTYGTPNSDISENSAEKKSCSKEHSGVYTGKPAAEAYSECMGK
jgi:hypothetical protein